MSGDDLAQYIAPTTGAKTLPVEDILTGRGFITGKSGSGKSVLEGTPVYTTEGRKPIEAVEKGENVLSLNRDTYTQEFREVQATLKHTDDTLVRITLDDGTELVGTEDHSFLTADGLEIVPIEGSDVTEGTWMPLARELPSTGQIEQIDLADYTEDATTVVIDDDTCRRGPRRRSRFLDLDAETGRIVGLYLAAGSVDSQMSIQMSNVDEDVRGFLDEWGFNGDEQPCIKGFHPFARFLQTEFGSDVDGKSLPGWVFDAPAGFRSALLSGYFDGDGIIDAHTTTAKSTSPELMDGLKELLRQFGVSTTLEDTVTGAAVGRPRSRRLTVDAFSVARFADVVELNVGAKADALAALTEAGDGEAKDNAKDVIPNGASILTDARAQRWPERAGDLYADGGTAHRLPRKQNAGRRAFNRLATELDVEGRATDFGRSDIQWRRVISVEELNEERAVYDLDVEHNDNFIANGVFVHNSNTASVITELLLENGYNLSIIDPEGEYYALKERYELLHVGVGGHCDVEVDPENGARLAEITLSERLPVIIDVSDYLSEDDAKTLIRSYVTALFTQEKTRKQPHLLVVEEMQEYLPQSGKPETAEILERVGKRGRKHGLGIMGMSQRPSSVDKDYITQCDWLVWHRLSWENDLNTARKVLGSERTAELDGLDDGEGYLITDWDDTIERVVFKRKQTKDAGATPGLEDYERRDMRSSTEDVVSQLDTGGATGEVADDAGTHAPGIDTGDAAELEAAVEDLELSAQAPEPTASSTEIETVDRDELEAYANQLERRNEILADEVRELRSILEVQGEGTEPVETVATVSNGGDVTASGSTPSEPSPPPRPRNRSGLAGTLVEFVAMLGYVVRVLVYKFRVAFSSATRRK